MKQRVLQLTVLVAGMGLLLVFAFASQSGPVSTYSTFEGGANGYEALFNVLRSEGVEVERLQQPLALRDAKTGVLAFTSTRPETLAGSGLTYDENDYKRLAAFAKSGGKIVYFASQPHDPVAAALERQKLRVVVLDVSAFTNHALSEHPGNARKAYDALAGHGHVAFDERLHGYGTDKTLWSVLPSPVRAAFWIVVVALFFVLVDANIRYAPPVVRRQDDERDSAAYIASMGSLLRRARAGAAAIARFAKKAKADDELQQLAQLSHPTDAMVVRAAMLAARQRKEGV